MAEQQLIPGAGGEELPDEVKAKKHAEYLTMFRGSLSSAAIALYAIKKNQTYTVDGYTKFRDFVNDELHEYGITVAEILACEGPLFQKIEDNPDWHEIRDAITAPGQLRPICKMDTDRQIRVLQEAIESAGKTRAGRPLLTAAIIEEVAARPPYNWTPSKKGSGRQRSSGDKPKALQYAEKRWKDISELGLSPEEAVEAWSKWEWDHFERALEFMRQCKRLKK